MVADRSEFDLGLLEELKHLLTVVLANLEPRVNHRCLGRFTLARVTYQRQSWALPRDAGRLFAEQVAILGCQLALDDFGTGFASLSYLKQIPAQHLKIDIAMSLRSGSA